MPEPLLSLDEFAGAGGSAVSSPPPGPAGSSTPAILDFDTFKAGGVYTPSGEKTSMKAAQVFDKTLGGLKAVGGEAAALADLALSLPGFILGVGAQTGGTVQAAARGVPLSPQPGQLNPVTAYTVGREAGREFAEPFMNPLQKLMQIFKSGDAYEQAATTKGMTKLTSLMEDAGKWAEEATGGRISRDAVPMMAETLMGAGVGLVKGAKPGEIPTHVRKAMQESSGKIRREAEAERTAEEQAALTPQEFAARVPVQQQINDLLGIKTQAQRAAEVRARRKDVAAAFKAPEEGGDYGSIEESQFRADERMRNEAVYREQQRPRQTAFVDPALEAKMQADEAAWQKRVDDFNTRQTEKMTPVEAQRILQKPGASRSPAEIEALRNAAQGGRATPEALAMLGAAGLGAVAGATLDEETLRGAVLGAASGMAFVAPFIGRGASVPKSFGQAGAVKAPGGMWHPEAVERLSNPLKDTITRGNDVGLAHEAAAARAREALNIPQDMRTIRDPELHQKYLQRIEEEYAKAPEGMADRWADRAVRNYLNRYAGTERDPLKDVEIPGVRYNAHMDTWNEGLVSWGEALDRDITSYPSEAYGKRHLTRRTPPAGARPGETIFDLGGSEAEMAGTIENYLSHVGDYLRQNVKPEKLKDYDLVRAVKETNANDIRVAKEMEKAQAASSKDLPTYKEYPDGYRWVELKLPEKLTEEQAKSIRLLSIGEKMPLRYGEAEPYAALDAQGKPIKNAYTGEDATGRTPEEAWLAGRLAEEGNQMGHCVGGYCSSVAEGESRIFSLRDPKGLSHVTIETTPTEMLISPELRKAGDEYPVNIEQIKGKQNRAPEAKYLPYVQDFVKSGKWGEVGDLQNTGLIDLQRQRPLGGEDLTQFEGRRFITTDEATAGLRGEAPPRIRPGQEGKIDQQLIVGLGALGLGGIAGWAMTDDPSGALLGALAGGALSLPGVRGRLKLVAEAVDYGIGNISTRIGNISPAVRLRGREYERAVLTKSHEILHRVAPFMQEMQKISREKRGELERAILTNDREKIASFIKGNPEMVAAWREVRNVLNELGEQLQGHGRFRSMLDDYFPRLVKDVEGLKAALGAPERARLEKVLHEAEQDSIRKRGTPLTHIEQSAIINREIQGFRRPRGYQPGYAKPRGVEEVTEKLQPFYHTSAESVYAYVRGAVQDLELAKFFGKDLMQTEVGKNNYTNVEGSIGNLVGRELREGRIDHAQAQQLISLLEARFKGGERASSRLVQDVRNLANMGLLGNFVSATTQVADSAMAIYSQGLRSTITAMARQATKERISAKDFGLADHIAEEFVSTSKTAGWLNSMFKYSGFTAIDRFGKNVQLQAAHDKFTRWAQSPTGAKRIQEKYGSAFGEETPALIRDLRDGKMTERVRALLFSELSDMQPISKMELPEAYLRHPNGRIVYMLKTYMLKQFDVVRRDALQEIAKGNVAKGIANLTKYALILGLAETTTTQVKNWLMGRPTDLMATDFAQNALKTFGWSNYMLDKIKQGKPVEATVNAFAPPYQMMDEIIRRDPKAVQYVPIIGKLYYNWELGGRERGEIYRSKQTGAELSERAKEFRREQRRKAREKREAAQ